MRPTRHRPLQDYTRREEDRYYRKVPSLRNVAVTAPYLHDASAATLEDAVRIMARYQLGKHLDSAEISNIVGVSAHPDR
jgi:cytochrome c peroxidase